MGQYGVPRGKTLWVSMVYQEGKPYGSVWCTKRENQSGQYGLLSGGNPVGQYNVAIGENPMGQYGVQRGKPQCGNMLYQEGKPQWDSMLEENPDGTVWCTKREKLSGTK